MERYNLKKKSITQIPRNFILLNNIKDAGNYTHVTYGLINENEGKYKNNYITLEHWIGTLMYDNEEDINILGLTFQCTKNFPKEPPVVKFNDESLKFVDFLCNEEGYLTDSTVKKLKWNNNIKIAEYIRSILDLL